MTFEETFDSQGNNSNQNKDKKEEINETEMNETKEKEIQEQEEEQEDVEQKERDEKIRNQLIQINQQFDLIIEKIEIHKKILQEMNETEETKQIESAQQLKFTKKSFQENQIKLEKLLLSIDSLVGASEKLRPEKKKTVNQIQKSISEIDQLLGELKSIENKIEKLQKEKQLQQQEEQQQVEEEINNVEQEKQEIENVEQQEEKKQDDSEKIESKKDEKIDQQEEPLALQFIRQLLNQKRREEEVENQKTFEKMQPIFNKPVQKNIVVQTEKEDNEFPFPSKEQWQLLRFEPKFNFQQTQNKMILTSSIQNLNAEEIKIKTNEEVLKIEGVKYPNEQEKQLLIKKLIQSVNNPFLLRRLTPNQIISAILKIATQYNFGKFSVKYELPSNFDFSQDVDATYKNGVLQIELPIINKLRQNPFTQQHFRPEVPFYGQRSRRPNNFWDFF